MPRLIFTHVTAILPDRLIEDAQVTCEKGRITAISRSTKRHPADAQVIDGRGAYISPGFIDIHVHGGAGADFMDGTAEAVRTSCRAHAKHGTTTIFPTTTTGSPAQIHAMLNATCKVQKEHSIANGSRIAGVHLYGPFFAEDKVGCHSLEGRRSPTPAEYRAYFDTGIVRVATCAAELPGAAEFYTESKKRRCLITCGHSNASWPEMAAAFKKGMRHVDHFWCAMSNVSSVRARCGVPMRGSMLEFVLGTADMSTEVIADGCHLAPELLDFAFRLKGPRKLCLVTDCNRALDQPPGKYRFGAESDGSWFESDGKVGWAPNGSLASSIVGMDRMVRQMKKDTSATLPEVIRMASLTPAELTGIAKQTGSIAEGKSADLLLLNRKLEVRRVFIGGQEFR
ncbi:N-acetylglucosamine-6-phosphate deacetylase [Brevifollis gellanilyticus]|uniref:N-acetylglucosamine-6-phosphate deacetylase n=1 Tax=Brevifollis gellanilyticus TaxID=748831 RepID=A0A512MI36_9BACT|nr:N-acetylglucosamine-6-phosphate deacetylase [Brevifollis gellanilyticus]GEP45991.1 N-acetylglucosamine-6-phosphate deacetylase [Brevifollis gellanilyticus]